MLSLSEKKVLNQTREIKITGWIRVIWDILGRPNVRHLNSSVFILLWQRPVHSMDVMWLKSQNLICVMSQKGAGHLSIRKLPWDLLNQADNLYGLFESGQWLNILKKKIQCSCYQIMVVIYSSNKIWNLGKSCLDLFIYHFLAVPLYQTWLVMLYGIIWVIWDVSKNVPDYPNSPYWKKEKTNI